MPGGLVPPSLFANKDSVYRQWATFGDIGSIRIKESRNQGIEESKNQGILASRNQRLKESMNQRIMNNDIELVV